MVGRLDQNLRQGHRAELEGIDLLRPFCAVAPVPQTEDMGFDAVATLLRRDGRYFYAEDSFYVQFKSRSVREIELKPHEHTWFHSLSMPLFIGSMDIATQEVELFTTHPLAGHPNARDFTSATMYLDPGEDSLVGDHMRLWLGEPVLRWTHQEVQDPEFQTLAYAVLKQWNSTEYVNLGLRHIRTRKHVWDWKTNELPGQSDMASLTESTELVQDLEAAMPYLSKVAGHLYHQPETDKGVPLATLGLCLLLNWMLEQNVPDAETLGRTLGLHGGSSSVDLTIEGLNANESGKQGNYVHIGSTRLALKIEQLNANESCVNVTIDRLNANESGEQGDHVQ